MSTKAPTSSPLLRFLPPSQGERLRRALVVAGPIAVAGVAWASTSVRGTMAIANVALVMAAITVAVAVVSWKAGLSTSVVAALSLNFFHTQPVHSLRITQGADVLAVVLLATIGIAASAATAIRVRAFAHEHVAVKAAEGRSLLVTAGSQNRPVDVVWIEAVRAACAGLSLVDCRIEPTGSSRLPSIARQRADVDGANTFVLPESGAVISMRDPRHPVQVVLTPRPGMGSLEVDRRAVMSFVDQLELVLDSAVVGGVVRGTL
ncbi:MAG: DUF4118 domain-containing protein [Acidimicrobiales bacterium]